MKPIFLSFILITSVISSLQAQKAKFIGLETGFIAMDCQPVEKPYIRGDQPIYNGDFYSYSIKSQFFKIFTGVKVELRTANDKFGFLSGLRFTQLTSSIRKSETPGYFYLLYNQNGTTTEYFRVHSITQSSSYASIPLEVRYFPFPIKKFRIYFKTGTDFNVQLHTKTTANFTDPSMESYQDDVKKIVGNPNTFFMTLFGGVGVHLGKVEKPGINLEVSLPAYFPTQNVSSLTTPNLGGGIQLFIQIPF